MIPRGAPKPPPELWAEMEAAGKAGDELALGLVRAKYAAWAADRGYSEPHLHGSEAPDTAFDSDHEDDR